MNPKEEFKTNLLTLIEMFESEKHNLQNQPAVGTPRLVFADVALINTTEPDPFEDSFISKEAIRSEMPQIYTWLFFKFASALKTLPNYNHMTKGELFGRLGNTVKMLEAHEPPLEPMEKVAALFADVYEAGLDLIDGKTQVLPVAFNGAIADDFKSRSVKADFVDLETFQNELFGEAE